MEGQDDKFLWLEWVLDIAMQPYPHWLPIEKLRGYEDTKEFKDKLWELELMGWVKVDYWQGVSLTPQALTFLMVNILRCKVGKFRQVCQHILNGIGREGCRDLLSNVFEHARKTRPSGLPLNITGEKDEDFF